MANVIPLLYSILVLGPGTSPGLRGGGVWEFLLQKTYTYTFIQQLLLSVSSVQGSGGPPPRVRNLSSASWMSHPRGETEAPRPVIQGRQVSLAELGFEPQTMKRRRASRPLPSSRRVSPVLESQYRAVAANVERWWDAFPDEASRALRIEVVPD